MSDVKSTDAFSRSDVLRILALDAKLLRRWERDGLFEPRTRFEFLNLRELRNLQRLHRKVSRFRRNKRLKDLLNELGRWPGVRRPLLDAPYVWEAPGVVVKDGQGRLLEPDTKQMVFNYGPIPPARAAAVELPPRPRAPGQLEEAERWFQRGLEIEENGGPPAEATAAYRRSIELNPTAAGSWVNLGTLQYRAGALEASETSYRRALEIAPSYALGYFNLGNICEETGRLDEAVEQYETALRLEPAYADAHYNVALVYERLGEPMQSAKHWRAYLKLDPASPWAGIARQQLQALLKITPGGLAARGRSPV